MGNPFSSSSSNKQSTAQPTASTAGSSSPATAVGGNYTIDSSPTITAQAFNAIQALVGQALNSQGTALATQASTTGNAEQTIQNQTGDLSNLVGAVLANDQATAANTASGGQTNTNSTVLWVVGIAAAALALILISRK